MAIAAFKRFDVDGSGQLDVNEFHKAMQQLGMGSTLEDAENLFGMMDEDGSGTMDMEEFLTHCREYINQGALMAGEDGAGLDWPERAKQVFQRYDNFGQGALSLVDFLSAVRDLGIGVTEEDARNSYDMLDSDGSGNLIESEFIKYVVSVTGGGGEGASGGEVVFRLPEDPVARAAGPLRFTGNPAEDAKECFRRFDDDGNGYLDIYEFMRAMKELGLPTSFAETQALFAEIDTDGTGTMEEEEFVAHYVNHIVSQRQRL
jgi:centrin-1